MGGLFQPPDASGGAAGESGENKSNADPLSADGLNKFMQ